MLSRKLSRVCIYRYPTRMAQTRRDHKGQAYDGHFVRLHKSNLSGERPSRTEKASLYPQRAVSGGTTARLRTWRPARVEEMNRARQHPRDLGRSIEVVISLQA